jgi:hypothetical protein
MLTNIFVPLLHKFQALATRLESFEVKSRVIVVIPKLNAFSLRITSGFIRIYPKEYGC